MSVLQLHSLNVRFERWICFLYCRISSLIDLVCLPISFRILHFYLVRLANIQWIVTVWYLFLPSHLLSHKLVFTSWNVPCLEWEFYFIQEKKFYIYIPDNSIITHLFSFWVRPILKILIRQYLKLEWVVSPYEWADSLFLPN